MMPSNKLLGLLLPIWLIAIAGCGRSAPEGTNKSEAVSEVELLEREPPRPEEIRLPVAQTTSQIEKTNQPALFLNLNAKGELSVRGHILNSPAEAKIYLASHLTKRTRRECCVVIRADWDADRFLQFFKACLELGFRRFQLRVIGSVAEEGQIELNVATSGAVLVGKLGPKDLAKPRGSPDIDPARPDTDLALPAAVQVTLRTAPNGPKVGSIASIKVAFPEGEVMLQDARQLGEHLKRRARDLPGITEIHIQTEIEFMPEARLHYASLIEVLDVTRKAGFERICLFKPGSGPNLENDDIGLDPSLPSNYNVERIEDPALKKGPKADVPKGSQTAPPPPGFKPAPPTPKM